MAQPAASAPTAPTIPATVTAALALGIMAGLLLAVGGLFVLLNGRRARLASS